MALSLLSIPVELFIEIVSTALFEHPRPSDVLSVGKLFLEVGQRILHTHIRFQTLDQLTLFAEGRTRLACCPRTLTVTLAGGTAGFDVFLHLAGVLRRCRDVLIGAASRDEPPPPVPLDMLSLCLHSHIQNPNLQHIYDALVMANPKTFVWNGPDPDHHFSTAIVPTAAFYLFRAIRTWTRIVHITITSVSFPSDELGLHGPLAHDMPLLPVIPTLRTLSLGQATLLPPGSVAAMICLPGQDSLELVRLVDAYSESIWGSRIRRRDVERAAIALTKGAPEDIVVKVRRLVRCEAKTERIMGGDRVEGLQVLE